MAAKFEVSFPKTMGVEGGCNYNPNDKGNIVINGACTVPTYSGIAPFYHRGWRGFAYVKDIASSMKNRPAYDTPEFWRWKKLMDKSLADSPVVQNLVKAFYKANFWDNYRLGEITSQEVADWIFDHVVNAGGRGVKWAQMAARVKPDGGMGSITLAAINAMAPKEFIARAADLAGKHRLDVANGNPSQIPFLTSWLNRDGQPAEIVAMVKAAARDGRIDERDEVDLGAAMDRC